MMDRGIPLTTNPPHSNKPSAHEDPYFLVKNNVTECIHQTKQYINEYANLPLTSSPPQINQKLAQLQSNLNAIQTDIEDIQDSIQIVEQHPHRFKLSRDEINKRKQFLEWCKTSLNEIQTTKISTQAKFEKYQRDNLLKGSPNLNGTLGASPQNMLDPNMKTKATGFIEAHAGHQQMLIKQQDQQLDSVLHTVTNMKEVALTMGQELDDQVGLLHEMDQHVDSTQSKMTSAMERVKIILNKSNDTKATCAIIVLIILLIVLLIFIII